MSKLTRWLHAASSIHFRKSGNEVWFHVGTFWIVGIGALIWWVL